MNLADVLPGDRKAASTYEASSRGQDQGDFERFFEAEHARLFRVLFLATGDRRDAEDLMQESFLRVWLHWERVRAMEEPVGYLHKVALNQFRSAYRTTIRKAKRSLPFQGDRDLLAEVEENDVVVRALRTIPPRQRTALLLVDLLNYSSKGASQLMGIREGTVRSLASQGREALRTRIGDLDG